MIDNLDKSKTITTPMVQITIAHGHGKSGVAKLEGGPQN